MKRAFFIIAMLLSVMPVVLAQQRVVPNKPFSTLRSTPGFVTINELTGGFGLAGKASPYSKYFYGFSSVNGYQVNTEFFLGVGVGMSFYDAGLLVPLFLDFRYAFSTGQICPYLYADGGLRLQVSDLNQTKLFINPGVGARYALERNLALDISAGFLSHANGFNRESFINFKLGVIYKFK
jgi:opacity protein-like surface antigen